MRSKIIFGNALYLSDSLIRIKKRKNPGATFGSDKSWKEPYVANITGLDKQHTFNRSFIERDSKFYGSTEVIEFKLPEQGYVELGWIYSSLGDTEPQTIYLMSCGVNQWIEVTASQMSREQQRIHKGIK